MPPSNTGSFGASIGGADALTQAMQRRGMDVSILEQTSPAAPGQSQVAPAVQGNSTLTSPSPQTNTPTGQSPFRSGEMEIALKALSQTVSTENAVTKSVLKYQ